MVIHIAYMIYFLFKAINQYCFTNTLNLKVILEHRFTYDVPRFIAFIMPIAHNIMMIIQLRAIIETNAFRVNY